MSEPEKPSTWEEVKLQLPVLAERLKRIRDATLALKAEYEKQLKGKI